MSFTTQLLPCRLHQSAALDGGHVLFRQTLLSITQIAERLHFAEVTTFARFFQRMKGITPREVRKGK